MSTAPEFRLVPISELLEHEEIDPADAARLAGLIRRAGELAHPIWVARDSGVILNGHHRVAALRALGAEKAPAWILDYGSDSVRLGRWKPGPPLSKEEVVRRAREHRPFPPKTTRHRLEVELPDRATRLADLLPAADGGTDQRRASGRSRSPGSGATGST